MNLELFRPNIFDYATRELSQDAMICWLLACLHSKDEIFEELQSYNITISKCKSDKISSQNNLFKFFIADKNKAEDVCRYLNEFKTMFIQKVCKVFGNKIVVL